jgi:hypothetical protein
MFNHGKGRFWIGAKTGYGKVSRTPSVNITNTMENLIAKTTIYKE